jgi:hypothetical protein
MNKQLQKVLAIFYLAAVFLPAVLSFTDVYEVHADGEILNITLQQDPSVMADASLRSATPNTNYGTSISLYVGESNAATDTTYAVLRFDMAALPSNITITSATLSLWVRTDMSDNARTMRAIPILKTNSSNYDWVESSTTYNATQTGGVPWSYPPVGSEIGNVALASDLAPATKVDVTLTAASVQQMIKHNYDGFKLVMDTNTNDQYLFYSSDETTNTSYRPQLYLEYTLGDIPTGQTWKCLEPISGFTGLDCGTTTPINTPVADPILIVGNYMAQTYGNASGTQASAAVLMDCSPYPMCKNDYPVYYKMTFAVSWSNAEAVSSPKFRTSIEIRGGTNIAFDDIDCGVAGTSGSCSLTLEGIIDVTKIGTQSNSSYYDFVVHSTMWTTYPYITYSTVLHQISFSFQPYNDNCSNTYVVPAQYAYTIDPTIETPAGTPTDDQIFPTVVGEIYMVRLQDGPWNDGSADRYDAAVSVDGSTWQTLEEFSESALCVDTDLINPQFIIVYFAATTTTFHIRANDTAAAFADNTNDEVTPFQYKIGVAYELTTETCESQFTYDSGETFASIALLNSNDEDGQRAADAFTHYDIFQPGEWYAVEVTSGTWQDNGGPASIDMQYVFTGPTASGGDWADLAGGSTLVQCVHSGGNIVFVQAIDNTLNLRVDDADSNFTNNTGNLTVQIYHALRDRPSETCEMRFALDDLVRSDSVAGNQANGKVFALAVGTGLTNSNNTDEFFLSGGLVPGAWYALETTGGPWGYLGNYHYDLAVAEEDAGSIGITPSDAWEPLETWSMADCNIQTDPLGHRLVYFQIPISSTKQWKLRVNASGSFFMNGGSMSWNLYRTRDLGFTPDGTCDYSYAPEDKITPSPQVVQATAVNGATLALAPDTFYAVEILGYLYSWAESSGGTAQTDMEISLNNGQTWADIPGGNVLCSQTSGDNLIFFLHTGTSPQVRLRVNSTTFDNNTGQMGWNIYLADAGSSITGCTTEGYSISTFGPIEWIPVQDDTGRAITSTSASYAEIGGLVSGKTYIIETNRGGWTDGETTTEHFDAEVSSDGGVTWFPLDGTNPDVQCWQAMSLQYRQIQITVIDGQDWRIRVADTDTATFADNGGNLAYTLKGMVLPDDEIVQGTFNLMGCNTPAVAPSLSEVDSFTGLANYLAGWFDYSVASVVNFFAWCPEHTASLSYFGQDIKDREPFATIDEFDQALNDIKNDLNSYDWGATEDYSVLDKSPAESAAMIQQYIFEPLPDDSPWVNGNLVDFSSVDTTDYYATCTWAAADYVGPRLAGGVCFASNWSKEIGFTFYIQLMLDVAVMFGCIQSVIETLLSALGMLTGVYIGRKR